MTYIGRQVRQVLIFIDNTDQLAQTLTTVDQYKTDLKAQLEQITPLITDEEEKQSLQDAKTKVDAYLENITQIEEDLKAGASEKAITAITAHRIPQAQPTML
jgi:uncharacterized phage infection (PIP) family protein YhgE